VGQVAVTTGISYGCASLISSTATIVYPDQYTSTPGKIIAIHAGLLISHGLINTFGVRMLRLFNHSSVLLHSLGVGSLAIALLAKATSHQTSQFVFFKFYDGTGGWSERASPAYVAACGILCEHVPYFFPLNSNKMRNTIIQRKTDSLSNLFLNSKKKKKKNFLN
jgi:hypothetical protein